MSPLHGHAFKLLQLRHLFDIEHGFLQPSDVAVGKDHRIYVLDGVNHRVKVFDDNGRFIFFFGGKGSSEGLFDSPLGFTTDRNGRVYIADTGNRRIQIFSPQGEFRSLFPVKTGEGEGPSDPVDIAVDEGRERIYVVDNDNHHLLVYSLADFKLLDCWGSEGDGMQMFRYPFFITLGKGGTVFVVDVLNTRVQMWTPKGVAVHTIGDWGVDVGQLYRPKGVCVDKYNNVFISDSYVGVVQVFNRYGYLKSVLGDTQGKIIKWKTPVGITIDDRRRFYVVEMLLNRVRVYRILDKTIEWSEK